MRRFNACLIALFAFLLGTAASSPAQPIAERPVVKAGDRWLFRFTSESDGTSGNRLWTIDRVLADDRLEIRTGQGRIQYYDHAMNWVGESPGADVRLLARYPMRVGDTWSYSRRFENPDLEERGAAKVVAYEKVTVQAGTFDCYHVEADTTYVNPGGSTQTHLLRWYCPAIKWYAKEHLESRTTAKYALGSTLTQTSELIRYTPAP